RRARRRRRPDRGGRQRHHRRRRARRVPQRAAAVGASVLARQKHRGAAACRRRASAARQVRGRAVRRERAPLLARPPAAGAGRSRPRLLTSRAAEFCKPAVSNVIDLKPGTADMERLFLLLPKSLSARAGGGYAKAGKLELVGPAVMSIAAVL